MIPGRYLVGIMEKKEHGHSIFLICALPFSKMPPRVSMLYNTLSKYKTPRSFVYRVLKISNSSSLSLDADEFESDNVPYKCSRVLEVGQGINWILVNFLYPECQLFHILIRTQETDWNLITSSKANIQPTLVSSFPLRCHVHNTGTSSHVQPPTPNSVGWVSHFTLTYQKGDIRVNTLHTSPDLVNISDLSCFYTTQLVCIWHLAVPWGR